eukprot:gene7026-7090_t
MSDIIVQTALFDMGFVHNPLNRCSEWRDDAEVIAALKTRRSARSIVIARDMPILYDHNPLFEMDDAANMGEVTETVFLGMWDKAPIFGMLLDDAASKQVDVADQSGLLDTRVLQLVKRPELNPIDMRSIATKKLVSDDLVGILGQAKAVLHWHNTHRFCGRCGAKTTLVNAGWRRDCAHCSAQHFPRTDPVVIMLVVDGERALLGRQPRFPQGMYSCLAGFLESGETLEAAVRREIFEEAGLQTGEVRYLTSQPWPFPASLMIGCIATAQTTDIKIDAQELEDARWFSRVECRALLAGTHEAGLTSPQPMAIAHHILKAWVEG